MNNKNRGEKTCPAFQDRAEAGRILASKLVRFAGRPDVVVLALPPGGVPVGFEIAQMLAAPLDVFIVHDVPTPGHSDIVMGTLTSGGVLVLNPDVVHEFNIPDEQIQAVVAREQQELERLERKYRVNRPPPANLRGNTVILVDDGVAASTAMLIAARAVFDRSPAWLTIALPVATAALQEELKGQCDEAICVVEVSKPDDIGRCYRELPPVSDEQIRELLDRAARPAGAA